MAKWAKTCCMIKKLYTINAVVHRLRLTEFLILISSEHDAPIKYSIYTAVLWVNSHTWFNA
jgi:hypothetical protein